MYFTLRVHAALRLGYMSAVIRRARLPLALLALGAVCAVLVARLPPDLERSVVTRRHHGSDPLLSAALLRFDVESLLRRPARYFSPPFLYPDANPLRGTEPLLSEALLAVPFRLALGDEPAAVYTSTKLATLVLVALFTGLLLRELGVRTALCLLGGGLAVLVGTMPVFVDRLQAVSIQWLPLAGLFASRWLRRSRLADAALFASSIFLAVQASLYTTAMLLVPLPFVATALWGRRREMLERGWPLAAGVAAAAAASVATLWPYLHRRADVAAYSSPTYSAVKTWHPASLGDFAVSPPEYAGWPLGPAADWHGLFPGAAFVLLLAGCATLSAVRLMRPPASGEVSHGLAPARQRAFRASGVVLVVALLSLAAATAWSARRGAMAPILADVLLWTALGAWSLRLALWPATGGHAGPGTPLGLLASSAALAAFVLWLLSLGTPIRWQEGGVALLDGVFGPLSRLLSPVRELRELNRCLLPAGWLAVVGAVLSLEGGARARGGRASTALVTGFAALVLLVGLCERVSADTRKGTAPLVPQAYELLGRSTGRGGLLELPFDPWGRIDSVYRMLWQPSHGRPIVAGRTGIEPGWYVPAQQVFSSFPSQESLLLARAWAIDTVLDTRAGEAPEGGWPAGVVLRAERAAQAGRRTDATWRLFDLLPVSTAARGTQPSASIEEEPPPGPGEWRRPAAAWAGGEAPCNGDEVSAAAACDGRTETAAEIDGQGALELVVPAGASLGALEIDYGHGVFNRVPGALRVSGLERGAWRDLGAEPVATWLRARVAHQLLRQQQARVVIPLAASRSSRIRLSSPDAPWDAPEIRLRLIEGP